MVEKRKSPDQIVVARVHHAAGSSDHLMFAQEPESPVKQANQTANPQLCHVDLTRPGTMKDIISNALLRGLDHPESEVKTFLHGAETRFSTGTELLQSAARHFKISDSVMNAAVEKFKHCNCSHVSLLNGASHRTPVQNDSTVKLSQFSQDVTLHVVLHEVGHALIREFDLPVLGNEECMADAFATCYLTTHLPDRAVDVIQARTRSLMLEAKEVPRDQWSIRGEHNNDARRAFQISAIAIAADSNKYSVIAKEMDMSEDDIRNCRDYGAEIHRSWRRILRPLWMPDGITSNESRVKCDPQCTIANQLQSSGILQELATVIGRFDWHSQVTIHFTDGDGGAGWSRSRRTITVHSEYIRRFIQQGTIVKRDPPNRVNPK